MSNFDFNKIKGAALAPMAGVADSAFREICRSYGAVFTVTEMISAKALCFQDKKSRELMRFTENERPCGIQLFGSEPDIMAKAAKIAAEYEPDFIDINMGCPVPKVAGNGCGSALMRSPELAGEIVKAVAAAVDLPVSVKIRKGWDNNSVNAVEIAKIAQENGAAAVAVHGRTKAQGYAGDADKEIIRRVREALKIPVIANGGIVDKQRFEEMKKATGCEIAMVARGALGNPFIFAEIAAGTPEPTVTERMETMIGQCELTCERRGEKRGILDCRKHAAWYIKGVQGAATFRKRAVVAKDLNELHMLANEIVEKCK
ncbi:MAG TPA: tRNA dihydrouridine synthase DusB [Oscillospiraceae bacterium]|nr:tRNA dihydrouridine synthase DusB [Oscillospiraceae bacterium]HPF56139.1 tRNA dihydrouridine synthase DusB [Clostridiales bacterium]HPK35403.1 tRNA dihydrouridine synthase DusB [Oscillospiraceae bacterium]HPR75304.1 tRNA dihydrouridine synthase DusB [Oscillospiraceae bacterium]